MKIRIAHSPDSDDAFMFYGLASGRVPSLGYELEHVLGDIETLNRAAFEGTYEITAADEGLKKIVDLGEWWSDRTGGLPLPLGGNVIRRDLGPRHISTLSLLLHDSIAFGLRHRGEAVSYAMRFGRGLDRAKTDRFVGMYVNDLTLDYGERGRTAGPRLLGAAPRAGLLP